jgi:hypothetical protein
VVHSFAGDDPLRCRDYVNDKLGLPEWKPTETNSHGINGSAAAASKVVATYDYRDAAGQLAYQVIRKQPKAFVQRRPDPDKPDEWVWNLQGVTRLPYRLPELLAETDDRVFIVEGEKDVEALLKRRFSATCNSGGAGNWSPDLNNWFAGKTVFILPDNDEPGRKHALNVAENLFGIARDVRIVNLPGLPEKGDVSDWFDAGGETGQFVGIALATPVYEPPANNANNANNGESRGAIMARLSISTAAVLLGEELPDPRYVIPGFVGEGVTLLAGAGKIGKSWMSLGFGVAIATPNGTTLGGVPVEHGDVLYLALEDNKRRMQRRLRKMLPLGNRPERLHLVYGWRSLDEGGLDDLRAWIEHVATDPKLIVIDVLEMVRPRQGRTEGIYSYDYRCLSPLKALAERYGVAIVVIHHTNKGTYADPFDCVSGSKGLTGAADSTLVLTRDAQGAVLYGRGRDIEEFETAVVFDRAYGTWTATGAAEEARRSTERNIILNALLKAGGSLSPSEISAATRMKGENVRFLLFKMVSAGEVLKCKRGRYTHPDSSSPPNNANNANNPDDDRSARYGADHA